MRSLKYDFFVTMKSNVDRIIIEDAIVQYNGLEFYHKFASLLAFFNSKDVHPGDTVAVNLPNSIEYILCYFACLLGGLTMLPINPALAKENIDYILSISNPKLYVSAKDDLAFSNLDTDLDLANYLYDSEVIFFTSGTTSHPKGVVHSFNSMLANAMAFNKLTGLNEQTRMLHCLPMGYMAGFLNTVLCPLLAGGSIVITQQFNAESGLNFWDVVLRKSVNSLWLTPTMLAYLTRISRNQDVASKVGALVKNLFVGTAPLPVSVKADFAKKFGIFCLESYGTSESMLTSSNSSLLDNDLEGTGLVLEGCQIEVRDDDGRVLPAGRDGHIFIKSPYLLRGYLTAEHNSLLSPLQNGYFDTGDYGYINNNRLFVTARTKDLIIRGGVNISPRLIEEVLLKHNMVREVAVIGKPHAFWGEEIVAFVVPEDILLFDKASLFAYCQAYIAQDSIPSTIQIVDELPYAATGKIQKYKLKDLV